ncbi:pilus assembly PilX family protein [Massilia sp. TSP1-1-2]|uniref:pilus assembly PilX family protein n=1 Tax=Massilia sp. TSP1-1-2 TaxID=2804649 RepID=UPI003CEF722D
MNQNKQRGVVLITSLVILVVISLLALYMFGGFTQDEKISGNTREKARAVDAAFAALNNAQFWMGQPDHTYKGNWITGVPCSAMSATPVICSNELDKPTTLPWASGYTPTLDGMTVSAEGGTPGTYAASTKYHIQYIETVGKTPGSAMYRVTATASGGNATAVAVEQAIFMVSTDAEDIGGG